MTHKHHIIPKHSGGSKGPTREVTVAEHAEEHRRLWEMYGNKYDYIAWKSLAGQISIDEARRLAASHYMTVNNPAKRPEVREKIRLSKVGKPTWNKGKKGVQVPWNKGIEGVHSGEKNPMYGKKGKDNPKFGKHYGKKPLISEGLRRYWSDLKNKGLKHVKDV